MPFKSVLRVLVLAPAELDLHVLLDGVAVASTFGAASIADWRKPSAADSFARRLDVLLDESGFPAAAPDRVAAISGQRKMLACCVDPAAAPTSLLLRCALHADVAVLTAPTGRPIDQERRRAAELALLAGVPHLIVVGSFARLGQAGPLADDEWVAQALELRHDPKRQKVSCLLPTPDTPGGTTVELLGMFAAARTRQQEALRALPAKTLAAGASISQAASSPQPPADGFEATCLWLDADPLLPGREYAAELGGQRCMVTVSRLKYRTEAGSALRLAATTLEADQLGVCVLELDHAVPFAPFLASPEAGGLILRHPDNGRPLGVALLHFALRRARNLHWQAIEIGKQAHAELKHQRPCVLWLTGLSGAGKSTIANRLQQLLHALGHHTYLLDGDNVRHGLNKDLGFTAADRVENIRRVGEVARLMVDAGLIVITAFISPFRDERRMVRALMEDGEFVEVFVDTPLEEAERRDPKGLYRKARSGALKNFTGIDSPYEAPEHAEIRIDTTRCSADDAAAQVLAWLRERGLARAGEPRAGEWSGGISAGAPASGRRTRSLR